MEGPDRGWLEMGGVEVWYASPAAHARAAALLTEPELERARAFLLEESRQRYVVGRALARWGTGRLLELEPRSVPLTELPSGKPVVARGQARFNVAHSGALVVVAFAWGRDVGVDVERLRPRDELRIARRHFRPAEVAAIGSVQAAERTRLFARCWTRKEALLKAYGAAALLVGLRSLEQPFALTCASERFGYQGRDWALGDVPLPGADHVAAVAVEAGELRLRVQAWRP